MSETSGNQLQFSINESIWLQNGYEAEEIMSVALEPDITIEENAQYVAIKGALRLDGEYKPLDGGGVPDDDERDFQDLSRRTVDDITETDVGTALIEHRFPVDITIPANRIETVEDVFVTVESFDYTMTDEGCLQLEADVSISGLSDVELAPAAVSEDDRDYDYNEPDAEPSDYQEPLSFDAYRSYDDDQTSSEQEGPQIELNRRLEFEDEEENEEEDEEVLRDEQQAEGDMDYGEAVHPFQQYEVEAVPVASQYGELDAEEYHEDDEEDWEDDELDDLAGSPEKNALYLTKVLAGDDGTDQFSKVKMCIVQSGESLESISERYQVPITAILRKNHLESDVLDEGQVLYIPIYTTA